jgi:serine phosphatase RsbU (regulator of sigma subunit)
MFTDGYMDQFGGNNGRKMNKSKFRDLLTEAGKLTPEAAKEFFNAALNEWKQNHQQLDDILVIGVKL